MTQVYIGLPGIISKEPYHYNGKKKRKRRLKYFFRKKGSLQFRVDQTLTRLLLHYNIEPNVLKQISLLRPNHQTSKRKKNRKKKEQKTRMAFL